MTDGTAKVASLSTPVEVTRFDYDNQAWVVNGRYVRCGHRDSCRCYGRIHTGEVARHQWVDGEWQPIGVVDGGVR